jgi:hypothetical protein
MTDTVDNVDTGEKVPDSRPAPTPTVKDEVAAMVAVANALGALPPASRQRVLDYVLNFFKTDFAAVGANMGVRHAIPAAQVSQLPGAESRQDSSNIPDNLAELFSLASPATEYEKALIVAYHLAQNQGEEEFDSYRINSALTHLGHRVGNITRAIDTLVAQKPAPVVQTRKEGKTKQARKKFKLTVEGRRRVEQMLAGDAA